MLWECISLAVRSLPGAARASTAVKLHLLTDPATWRQAKHWESAGNDVQTVWNCTGVEGTARSRRKW